MHIQMVMYGLSRYRQVEVYGSNIRSRRWILSYR